jgi:hypothetical protein
VARESRARGREIHRSERLIVIASVAKQSIGVWIAASRRSSR